MAIAFIHQYLRGAVAVPAPPTGAAAAT
jgi:hypothetical protein